jgi:cyclopropane fatty-acyl-phospholipid synthase-like methyltransferase
MSREINMSGMLIGVGALLVASLFAQLLVDASHRFSLQAFLLNSMLLCTVIAYRATGRGRVLAIGFGTTAVTFLVLEVAAQYGLSLDSYESKVRNCYTWYNIVQRSKAMGNDMDLTEGLFGCDPFKPYADAQRDQREWLLDSMGVGPGTRILDVGSGNCNVLEAAKARGAVCRGVTLSQEQAALCKRQRGIQVEVMNFWELGARPDYGGRFDCILFNGPVEHFVNQAESVAGAKDVKYRRMFEIVRHLLDPASSLRRVAITCIHMDTGKRMSPLDYLQGYLYERTYGGSLPVYPDGLTRNADGFDVLVREDHTMDYYIASRLFFDRINRGNLEPAVLARCAAWYPLLFLYDRYFVHKVLHQLFGSWTWQFEPPSLARHLWLVLQLDTSHSGGGGRTQ